MGRRQCCSNPRVERTPIIRIMKAIMRLLNSRKSSSLITLLPLGQNQTKSRTRVIGRNPRGQGKRETLHLSRAVKTLSSRIEMEKMTRISLSLTECRQRKALKVKSNKWLPIKTESTSKSHSIWGLMDKMILLHLTNLTASERIVEPVRVITRQMSLRCLQMRRPTHSEWRQPSRRKTSIMKDLLLAPLRTKKLMMMMMTTLTRMTMINLRTIRRSKLRQMKTKTREDRH